MLQKNIFSKSSSSLRQFTCGLAAGWSAEVVRPFHYRTQAGQEVDVLLEKTCC